MKIESNERLAKAIRINLLDFKKKIIFPAIFPAGSFFTLRNRNRPAKFP